MFLKFALTIFIYSSFSLATGHVKSIPNRDYSQSRQQVQRFKPSSSTAETPTVPTTRYIEPIEVTKATTVTNLLLIQNLAKAPSSPLGEEGHNEQEGGGSSSQVVVSEKSVHQSFEESHTHSESLDIVGADLSDLEQTSRHSQSSTSVKRKKESSSRSISVVKGYKKFRGRKKTSTHNEHHSVQNSNVDKHYIDYDDVSNGQETETNTAELSLQYPELSDEDLEIEQTNKIGNLHEGVIGERNQNLELAGSIVSQGKKNQIVKNVQVWEDLSETADQNVKKSKTENNGNILGNDFVVQDQKSTNAIIAKGKFIDEAKTSKTSIVKHEYSKDLKGNKHNKAKEEITEALLEGNNHLSKTFSNKKANSKNLIAETREESRETAYDNNNSKNYHNSGGHAKGVTIELDVHSSHDGVEESSESETKSSIVVDDTSESSDELTDRKAIGKDAIRVDAFTTGEVVANIVSLESSNPHFTEESGLNGTDHRSAVGSSIVSTNTSHESIHSSSSNYTALESVKTIYTGLDEDDEGSEEGPIEKSADIQIEDGDETYTDDDTEVFSTDQTTTPRKPATKKPTKKPKKQATTTAARPVTRATTSKKPLTTLTTTPVYRERERISSRVDNDHENRENRYREGHGTDHYYNNNRNEEEGTESNRHRHTSNRRLEEEDNNNAAATNNRRIHISGNQGYGSQAGYGEGTRRQNTRVLSSNVGGGGISEEGTNTHYGSNRQAIESTNVNTGNEGAEGETYFAFGQHLKLVKIDRYKEGDADVEKRYYTGTGPIGETLNFNRVLKKYRTVIYSSNPDNYGATNGDGNAGTVHIGGSNRYGGAQPSGIRVLNGHPPQGGPAPVYYYYDTGNNPQPNTAGSSHQPHQPRHHSSGATNYANGPSSHSGSNERRRVYYVPSNLENLRLGKLVDNKDQTTGGHLKRGHKIEHAEPYGSYDHQRNEYEESEQHNDYKTDETEHEKPPQRCPVCPGKLKRGGTRGQTNNALGGAPLIRSSSDNQVKDEIGIKPNPRAKRSLQEDLYFGRGIFLNDDSLDDEENFDSDGKNDDSDIRIGYPDNAHEAGRSHTIYNNAGDVPRHVKPDPHHDDLSRRQRPDNSNRRQFQPSAIDETADREISYSYGGSREEKNVYNKHSTVTCLNCPRKPNPNNFDKNFDPNTHSPHEHPSRKRAIPSSHNEYHHHDPSHNNNDKGDRHHHDYNPNRHPPHSNTYDFGYRKQSSTNENLYSTKTTTKTPRHTYDPYGNAEGEHGDWYSREANREHSKTTTVRSKSTKTSPQSVWKEEHTSYKSSSNSGGTRPTAANNRPPTSASKKPLTTTTTTARPNDYDDGNDEYTTRDYKTAASPRPNQKSIEDDLLDGGKCGHLGIENPEYSKMVPDKDRFKPRVVNGTEAVAGQWPWFVSLRFMGEHKCAGTIVGPNHVISATHCFPPFIEAKNFTVIAGSHFKDSAGMLPTDQVRRIEKLTLHPHFDRENRYDNDIAVIRVNKPFLWNQHVQPVCLPKLREGIPDYINKCCVAGYGDTKGTTSEAVLNEICMPVLSTNKCNSSKFYNGRLTRTMICAGFEEGKRDACKGDSGGPFICQIDGVYKLIGVVSWGEGCAKENRPGLYTKVSLFYDWILEQI